MKTRPDVLAVDRSPDAVGLDLLIPPDLDCLPDHFPRFAIVPGVVQLAWAIDYGAQYLGMHGPFRELARLKFQHPLLPRARVRLTLSRTAARTLAFEYRCGGRTCSGGRVVFG